MSLAAKVFGYLEGSWHFERVVTGNQSAHATGIASFTSAKNLDMQLNYLENGRFVEFGTEFHQSYHYRLTHAGISVFFCEDMRACRLYHAIIFNKESSPLTATGAHHCVPDVYNVSYTFPSDLKSPVFEISCKVFGPKKDFTIVTKYHRQSSEEPKSGPAPAERDCLPLKLA